MYRMADIFEKNNNSNISYVHYNIEITEMILFFVSFDMQQQMYFLVGGYNIVKHHAPF